MYARLCIVSILSLTLFACGSDDKDNNILLPPPSGNHTGSTNMQNFLSGKTEVGLKALNYSNGEIGLEGTGVGHYNSIDVTRNGEGRITNYDIKDRSKIGGTPTKINEMGNSGGYAYESKISTTDSLERGGYIGTGVTIKRSDSTSYGGKTGRIYSTQDQLLGVIQGASSYFGVYTRDYTSNNPKYGTFFAGQETMNVPQTGTATYNGVGGGYMVVKNDPTPSQNGMHEVQANVTLQADFAADKMSGRIHNIAVRDTVDNSSEYASIDITMRDAKLSGARYAGTNLSIVDDGTDDIVGKVNRGEWAGILSGDNATETAGSVAIDGKINGGADFNATIGYHAVR
jgi:hypothetical protein